MKPQGNIARRHVPALKAIGLTFLFLSAVFFSPGHIAAASFSTSGYFKNFYTSFRPPTLVGNIDPTLEGAAFSRLRLRGLWTSGPTSIEIAYEASGRIQAPTNTDDLFRPPATAFSYRALDWRTRLYPKKGTAPQSFALFHNLDRVALSFAAPFGDLILGRQTAAFGSGRALNPTDTIAPFTYQTLDKEERTGVDGLRLRLPVGALGEIDAGLVFADDFDLAQSALFLRTQFYLNQTDIAPILVRFKRNLLLGLDLARTFGGAGWWLEMAHTQGRDATPNYLRLSTGFDYSLTPRLYTWTEYHFNGAGTSTAAAYLGRLISAPYTEGTVYLMGRHYLAPGLSFQATPLLTLSLQALVNLNDPSGLLAPRFDYSFADNVVVEAGGYIGQGSSPRQQSSPLPIRQARSEFGLYPSTYFCAVRLYF